MKVSSKTHGFALAIVMALLSILATALIGSALLRRLETRKTHQLLSHPALIARQNAYLALSKALEQLQSLTAKDTIATAPAQIFSSVATGSEHWTGVWEITPADDSLPDASDQKTFLGWLVSGDRTSENDGQIELPEDQRISILPPQYADIEPVFVPLISTQEQGKTPGQYAYWIEDQSFKIQCNLYDPGNFFPICNAEVAGETNSSESHFSNDSRESDNFNADEKADAQQSGIQLPEELYAFVRRQCPAIPGFSMLADADLFPLTQTFLKEYPEICSEPLFSRLLDNPKFSDSQKTFLQHHFHDFTTLSLELLTDSRQGGFRKNLCYRPENFLNFIPDQAFLFTPPTTFPAPPTTWGVLKHFFDTPYEGEAIVARPTFPLYGPQAGVDYSDCTLLTVQDPSGYLIGTITGKHAADLGIPTQSGIYPIWTAFKNYVELGYHQEASTPSETEPIPETSTPTENLSTPDSTSVNSAYYEALYMHPGFHLENPYSRPISPCTLHLGQWAPYVETNQLESKSQAVRFQKTPTFRCKFLLDSDAGPLTIHDALLQDYLEDSLYQTQNASGSTNGSSGLRTTTAHDNAHTLFPFTAYEPVRYMRPVIEGILTQSFPTDTPCYVALDQSATYASSGKQKALASTTSNDPQTYPSSELRFYQPTGLYQTQLLSRALLESKPNGSINGTPWPNSYDPWTLPCFRTTDANGIIFQQIADSEMKQLGTDERNYGHQLDRLEGEKLPLYVMCAGIRHIPEQDTMGHGYTENGIGARPFIEANPCAPISGRTAHQDDISSILYSKSSIPGNSLWNAHWLYLQTSNTIDENRPGAERLTHIPFEEGKLFRHLLDLPYPDDRCRCLNLGFLQHMNVGIFSYHPLNAFGNSYQNPWISQDRYFQENSTVKGTAWPSHNRVELLYDYSYCLNRALWDHHFISSVARAEDFLGMEVSDHFKHTAPKEDSFQSNEQNAFLLLNPRQKAFRGGNVEQLYDFDDAAKALCIYGAFNVNSTSEAAWAALLGSTLGAYTGNQTYAEYARIQTVGDSKSVGLVQLNAEQIRSLAVCLAKEIKKRGVAGSIGAFVNRKLVKSGDPESEFGLKGRLQATIDASGVNAGKGGGKVVSKRNKEWFDDEAASGDFLAGKPGYLTQADILQSIGTVLCARGDTFTIYFYGNALKEKTILAETRGAATVQRVAEQEHSNKGIRYKILSIRWF